MNGARSSLIVGVILIAAGIVLFWGSTRKTLTQTARGFLEGQGTIAIPAGLAAIGYGAARQSRKDYRQRQHRKEVENRRPGPPPKH